MRHRWMVLVILLAVVPVLCWAGRSKPPDTRLKVLFEVGGPVHNAVELPAMLKKVLEDTGEFVVTVTDDRDQFTSANVCKYDLVLIYTTGGSLTKEQEEGLVKFVEDGKGLVGIHSATDSFHNSDAYWKLLAGAFTGHGGGKFKVKITGKSHSIVAGMSDFEIQDETYTHKFHPQSKPIVLMRRETDGEPAAWVQYYGKGRVFVTGLGHGGAAWENPNFQKLIIRSLQWAAGRINP